jgi:hypothetical protein
MRWIGYLSSGSGSCRSSGSGSLPGIEYRSVAHAPRSISLQRCEQNGRHRFSGEYSVLRPQVGHSTETLIGGTRGAHRLHSASSNSTFPSKGLGRRSPPCEVNRIQSMYLFAEISGIAPSAGSNRICSIW